MFDNIVNFVSSFVEDKVRLLSIALLIFSNFSTLENLSSVLSCPNSVTPDRKISSAIFRDFLF